MTLLEYYRNQIALVFDEWEQGWRDEQNYAFGYQWNRQLHAYLETFRIVQLGQLEPSNPLLMYTITLPEAFKQMNIYETAQRYDSRYELNLLINRSRLQISVSVPCTQLTESSGGFLYRARAELLDVIDFTVNG